jgi:putative ABC transport system permease protein
MVAHERRKEISILRSLGATRAFVMKMMLTESFTLAIMGGLIGIGAASVILVAFQDFIALTLKIPFITPSPLALLEYGGGTLALAAVIGGIASFYPAVLVTRADPYETIRKGEP